MPEIIIVDDGLDRAELLIAGIVTAFVETGALPQTDAPFDPEQTARDVRDLVVRNRGVLAGLAVGELFDLIRVALLPTTSFEDFAAQAAGAQEAELVALAEVDAARAALRRETSDARRAFVSELRSIAGTVAIRAAMLALVAAI